MIVASCSADAYGLICALSASIRCARDGYRAHRTMRALGGMDVPAKPVKIKLRVS